MFKKYAEIVLIFKWPILLGLILITMITGGAIFHLQIDPSMETLFVKKSPDYIYYKEYREKYGSDQMIALAVATADLFTYSNLDLLKGLTTEIAAFKNVERVLSLANAMDIRHKRIGIKIVPALEGVFERERSLEDLKRDILSNELYLNNLISKDGKTANILIYLKAGGKDPNLNGEFIEKLREHLVMLEQPGLHFYMAGSPVEQYDFIRLIRRDQFTFVPLIGGLLVLTTLLIFRSFSCMVLSMSIVFMTLVWTLGTIAILGQQLNLMTSLLAPVIMIVAVVNSIYLMNVFFELRPLHRSMRKAVVLTIDQLGEPCFLTHFIAILGFASLAVNPIPAIKSFGIFAALGTFYSYIVEIVLTPLLLPILPYRIPVDSFDEKKFFNRVIIVFLERLDFQWKWLIILLTAAALFFSFKGISKIQVDTNIVKQMKPDLPLAIATRFIDKNLTGVYSLGFVLRRRDGGSFLDPDSLRQVDKFKAFLEAKPEIAKVNSITTLLKAIHRAKEGDPNAYEITSDRGLLKRYVDGIIESKDPEVFKMISPDLKEIRLDARMKAVGTTEGALVEETARRYLAIEMGKFECHLTGNVVLLGKMAKDLVDQQVESFIFAFLSILVLIIIALRSLRLGLLAAIPNLIPIVLVYGLMGFIQIELSTPTAMISSIVLGLVVDASIQFLYRFRLEFSKRHHYLQSLHHTYLNIGNSMMISTLILVIGFSSSIFASFRPTVHFGVLTALTIFLALICTLVVLPVFLIMVKPFGPQKLFLKHHEKKSHSVHS